MSRWLLLSVLLFPLLYLIKRWRWHQVRTEMALLEAAIKPPVPRFIGSDEALRRRTEARRDTARRLKGRAARVESGEPISELLRRVK